MEVHFNDVIRRCESAIGGLRIAEGGVHEDIVRGLVPD